MAVPQRLQSSNPDQTSSEPVLQRAVGQIRLGFKQRDSQTVLKDLFQQGSGKARLPRLHESEICEAVLINTSGGLTDHDRFAVDVEWEANTTAVVTSQAAERIYKSRNHSAYIETTLKLQQNALGFWLPQETILFDRGRFTRNANVTMAKGSRLLACESMVFGRAAMGEQVYSGFLSENWSIRYNDKLVFVDQSRLDENIHETLQEPTIANGMQAWGTILYIAEDAAEYVESIRQISQHNNVKMACSVRGPVLIIRILAMTGPEMRTMLTVTLETLYSSLMKNRRPQSVTHGQTQILPRVWYC